MKVTIIHSGPIFEKVKHKEAICAIVSDDTPSAAEKIVHTFLQQHHPEDDIETPYISSQQIIFKDQVAYVDGKLLGPYEMELLAKDCGCENSWEFHKMYEGKFDTWMKLVHWTDKRI